MASWEPLAQDPVLPLDEMLICSVVQGEEPREGYFQLWDGYGSQPHARDRIKRLGPQTGMQEDLEGTVRPVFMKEILWEWLNLA